MTVDLILASGSAIRRALLENAGLEPEQIVPYVDEETIRSALVAEGARPDEISVELASVKACKISARHRGRLILGADQILVCEGKILDKPHDMEAARGRLERLAGQEHELISAAVIAQDGNEIWRHIGHARLKMRDLSADFLDAHLDAVGPDVLHSVGAYQLEGLGAQLFAWVEGDYFTILGLPLLEILEFLRFRGILLR